MSQQRAHACTHDVARAPTTTPAAREQKVEVEGAVLGAIRELCGGGDQPIELDVPLLEAGLDSLAATELSSRLGQSTGVGLSPMLALSLIHI